MRLFFAVVVAKITFSADKYLIINKIIITILHGKVLSTALTRFSKEKSSLIHQNGLQTHKIRQKCWISQQSHLSVTFMSLMLKSRIVDKTTKGCESSNAIVSLSKESVVNLQ